MGREARRRAENLARRRERMKPALLALATARRIGPGQSETDRAIEALMHAVMRAKSAPELQEHQ